MNESTTYLWLVEAEHLLYGPKTAEDATLTLVPIATAIVPRRSTK